MLGTRSFRVLLCAPDRAERGLIESALRARGADVDVLDPSSYPGFTLSGGWGQAAQRPAAASGTSSGQGDSGRRFAAARNAIGGPRSGMEPDPPVDIAWHNIVVGLSLPEMSAGSRETCIAAAEAQIIGWLDALPCLDPYWTQRRADNKPYQLGVARAVGLDVPATLVTNDAAAVRAFAAANGPLVAKMLVQPRGDGSDVVFTTALDPGDDLDGLDLCPMIFQSQVPNAGDVRATVVGRRVIAAVLPPRDAIDWRQESYARDEVPMWSAYALPAAVEAQLLALADRLGLEYGAADFVRRPDGTHAFLELNASGSFAFLGEAVARSIAEALADVLVSPEARRCSR